MRKFLVLATVALGFVFTACDDEDNLNSSVLIGNKSGSNVIVQLDTLYLDARAENLSGTMEYLWTVDGKEVSTGMLMNSDRIFLHRTDVYRIKKRKK